MLVSVIIPTYNHEKFLPQRLESVLNQTFQDFEVIILDDCSPDNSRSILEQYRNHPKVSHIVYNEVNSGSTFKQWNKGIQLAKGEWIWIAESDDTADLRLLATLVGAIQNAPKTGIAYCQSYRMNDKGEVTGDWLDWTDDLDSELFRKDFSMSGVRYIEKYLIHKNTIPNASAVLFKKKYYQSVGGADENIRNCSDWELWLRILLIGDLLHVAEPLNYFRYHNQSVIARAISEKEKNVYLERYDRKMRLRFQENVTKAFRELTTYDEILRQNGDYILEENIYEALTAIRDRNFSDGYSKLKSLFKADVASTAKILASVILKESIFKEKKEPSAS